jgi:hypothetical protein
MKTSVVSDLAVEWLRRDILSFQYSNTWWMLIKWLTLLWLFHEFNHGDVTIFWQTLNHPEIDWSVDLSQLPALCRQQSVIKDTGFGVRLNPLTCTYTLELISSESVASPVNGDKNTYLRMFVGVDGMWCHSLEWLQSSVVHSAIYLSNILLLAPF